MHIKEFCTQYDFRAVGLWIKDTEPSWDFTSITEPFYRMVALDEFLIVLILVTLLGLLCGMSEICQEK